MPSGRPLTRFPGPWCFLPTVQKFQCHNCSISRELATASLDATANSELRELVCANRHHQDTRDQSEAPADLCTWGEQGSVWGLKNGWTLVRGIFSACGTSTPGHNPAWPGGLYRSSVGSLALVHGQLSQGLGVPPWWVLPALRGVHLLLALFVVPGLLAWPKAFLSSISVASSMVLTSVWNLLPESLVWVHTAVVGSGERTIQARLKNSENDSEVFWERSTLS
jgi:hypothetical protein